MARPGCIISSAAGNFVIVYRYYLQQAPGGFKPAQDYLRMLPYLVNLFFTSFISDSFIYLINLQSSLYGSLICISCNSTRLVCCHYIFYLLDIRITRYKHWMSGREIFNYPYGFGSSNFHFCMSPSNFCMSPSNLGTYK